MANPPGKLTPEILPGVGFSTFQTLKNTEDRLNQINALSVTPATLLHPVRTVIVDGPALASDETIWIDASAGNVTLTLPDANGSVVRYLTVSRRDGSANTVTIAAMSGQNINGAPTYTSLVYQYSTVHLTAGGALEWGIY